MTPPTAAPPSVPRALPPVSTEPATAPAPAPTAVLFSRWVMLEQPVIAISETAATVVTARDLVVFMSSLSELIRKAQDRTATAAQGEWMAPARVGAFLG